MRKSLDEIVKSFGVNYGVEYDSVFNLLHRPMCTSFPSIIFSYGGADALWDVIGKYFMRFPITIRDTNTTLDMMAARLTLPKYHECRDLDELLLLLELVFTLLDAMRNLDVPRCYSFGEVSFFMDEYLRFLSDKLNHKLVRNKNGFCLLVPRDMIENEVASQLPRDIAIKTFEYNHRSLKGNLDGKRLILYQLGKELEAHRTTVESYCRSISDDVFALINNLDVRHPNSAPDSVSYHQGVAALPKSELEKYYDDLYELMIAAFACYYCDDIHVQDVPKIKALVKK